ncbi:32433_t:CDS:2 [Gigaspora margarita]|uniref:32433_t:CDS:1 n=1 Tax=Gigaspora margarita TaxID=4874 RepID=A0ABN7UFF7_GIGMA|nr:32433_t:CDS:2 [Gigaspora margarita]
MSDKPRKSVPNISPKIKLYINSACQATITTLLRKMEELEMKNNLLQDKYLSTPIFNSLKIPINKLYNTKTTTCSKGLYEPVSCKHQD